MNDTLRSKIAELRHYIVAATVGDETKIDELQTWFTDYMKKATPSEKRAVREATAKLMPVAHQSLIEIADTCTDPEVAALAKLDLERLSAKRPQFKN